MAPLEDTPKQASYKEKAISKWNLDDLVGWINEKESNLLDNDEIEKLRKAKVRVATFLSDAARDVRFFTDLCGIHPGIAAVLVDLSKELTKEDSKLLSFVSCTPRRQQVNNVTGNRRQAENVDMSAADTAGKSTDHAPLLFSLH